jgi:hypothetical protein
MDFRPLEISIPVLESNQTVYFAFNITLNSPGVWKMAVVAVWDGNITYGGDNALHELKVYRLRFEYSPLGVVIAIAAVATAPKAADLVIRRVRRIGS